MRWWVLLAWPWWWSAGLREKAEALAASSGPPTAVQRGVVRGMGSRCAATRRACSGLADRHAESMWRALQEGLGSPDVEVAWRCAEVVEGRLRPCEPCGGSGQCPLRHAEGQRAFGDFVYRMPLWGGWFPECHCPGSNARGECERCHGTGLDPSPSPARPSRRQGRLPETRIP